MNRIIVSSRCFFPKGAYFYSTKKISQIARRVGYQGVEFLSTWRFCWEMKKYGKILAPAKMIASGHRDWRLDRVMESKIKHKPTFIYEFFKNKYDWLFPPSGVCLKYLQKFQKIYKVPISTQWFDDTKNFSPVTLELWSPEQGITYKDLLKWLKEDPKNHGVTLDTAKFTSWLNLSGLKNNKKEVIKSLIPHTFEVHYRSKKKGYDKNMDFKGKLMNDSNVNFKNFLEAGYKGRIVVEYGWPDLDKPPLGLIKEDLTPFYKLHSILIKKINLYISELRP